MDKADLVILTTKVLASIDYVDLLKPVVGEHSVILTIQNGINKVGIPDLILVDHVISNNLVLYSENKHFKLMQEHASFELLQ